MVTDTISEAGDVDVLSDVFDVCRATTSNPEALRQLLSTLTKPTSINTADSNSETALHVAASSGHLDLCKVLIEQGADVLARNKKNRTPAAQLHLLDEIREYLEAEKANMKEKRQQKQSLLWDEKMVATQTQNACGVGVV